MLAQETCPPGSFELQKSRVDIAFAQPSGAPRPLSNLGPIPSRLTRDGPARGRHELALAPGVNGLRLDPQPRSDFRRAHRGYLTGRHGALTWHRVTVALCTTDVKIVVIPAQAGIQAGGRITAQLVHGRPSATHATHSESVSRPRRGSRARSARTCKSAPDWIVRIGPARNSETCLAVWASSWARPSAREAHRDFLQSLECPRESAAAYGAIRLTWKPGRGPRW